jgi:hypothetical protein
MYAAAQGFGYRDPAHTQWIRNQKTAHCGTTCTKAIRQGRPGEGAPPPHADPPGQGRSRPARGHGHGVQFVAKIRLGIISCTMNPWSSPLHNTPP